MITPRRSTLTVSLLSGILAVSTASIFIKLAQHAGTPSIVIAAARLTIASLALAPIALTRYRSELRQLTKREWILALLSGVFLALHFAVWITSLEYTSVASSVVLVTTTPLWVALFSPLVLRERVGKATFLGMLLALAGGVVVGLSDACTWQAGAVSCPSLRTFFDGTAFLGDFLALAGAWMAAGYMLVGRKLRAKIELVPYIFIVYGMAAIVLIVIMLGMGESPLGFAPQV
jgi:drug/metabolite transporter (DMT)-like permease